MTKILKILLREYQKKTIKNVAKLHRVGKNRLLVHLATGLGKTVVASKIPLEFPELFKHGMIVLSHRQEIIDQLYQRLSDEFPNKTIGKEMGDSRATGKEDIVIVSVATLGREFSSNRILKFKKKYGIIISDEAHHVTVGSTWDNVLNWFGVGSDKSQHYLIDDLKPLSIFLTATPNRSDKKGFHDFIDDVAISYGIVEGVRDGYLVDVKAFVTELKYTKGVEDVDDHRANAIVETYNRKCLGTKCLIFCDSVEEANSVAIKLEDVGIKSGFVCGETEKEERQKIVKDFKNNKIQVLTNFGVFTEGFDDSGIQSLILARSGLKSQSLYIQMVGRLLRPNCDLTGLDKESRLKKIADSNKPYGLFIDVGKNIKSNSLIQNFDLTQIPKETFQGKFIIGDLLTATEELVKERPNAPITKEDILDKVNLGFKRADIWNQTINSKELDIYNLRWIKQNDEYTLRIPRKAGSTPTIYRIFPSSDSEFTIHEISGGGWNGRFPAKAKIKSIRTFGRDGLHETINNLERVIKRRRRKIYKSLTKTNESNVLSSEQIKEIKKRKISYIGEIDCETAEHLILNDQIQKVLEKVK